MPIFEALLVKKIYDVGKSFISVQGMYTVGVTAFAVGASKSSKARELEYKLADWQAGNARIIMETLNDEGLVMALLPESHRPVPDEKGDDALIPAVLAYYFDSFTPTESESIYDPHWYFTEQSVKTLYTEKTPIVAAPDSPLAVQLQVYDVMKSIALSERTNPATRRSAGVFLRMIDSTIEKINGHGDSPAELYRAHLATKKILKCLDLLVQAPEEEEDVVIFDKHVAEFIRTGKDESILRGITGNTLKSGMSGTVLEMLEASSQGFFDIFVDATRTDLLNAYRGVVVTAKEASNTLLMNVLMRYEVNPGNFFAVSESLKLKEKENAKRHDIFAFYLSHIAGHADIDDRWEIEKQLRDCVPTEDPLTVDDQDFIRILIDKHFLDIQTSCFGDICSILEAVGSVELARIMPLLDESIDKLSEAEWGFLASSEEACRSKKGGEKQLKRAQTIAIKEQQKIINSTIDALEAIKEIAPSVKTRSEALYDLREKMDSVQRYVSTHMADGAEADRLNDILDNMFSEKMAIEEEKGEELPVLIDALTSFQDLLAKRLTEAEAVLEASITSLRVGLGNLYIGVTALEAQGLMAGDVRVALQLELQSFVMKDLENPLTAEEMARTLDILRMLLSDKLCKVVFPPASTIAKSCETGQLEAGEIQDLQGASMESVAALANTCLRAFDALRRYHHFDEIATQCKHPGNREKEFKFDDEQSADPAEILQVLRDEESKIKALLETFQNKAQAAFSPWWMPHRSAAELSTIRQTQAHLEERLKLLGPQIRVLEQLNERYGKLPKAEDVKRHEYLQRLTLDYEVAYLSVPCSKEDRVDLWLKSARKTINDEIRALEASQAEQTFSKISWYVEPSSLKDMQRRVAADFVLSVLGRNDYTLKNVEKFLQDPDNIDRFIVSISGKDSTRHLAGGMWTLGAIGMTMGTRFVVPLDGLDLTVGQDKPATLSVSLNKQERAMLAVIFSNNLPALDQQKRWDHYFAQIESVTLRQEHETLLEKVAAGSLRGIGKPQTP